MLEQVTTESKPLVVLCHREGDLGFLGRRAVVKRDIDGAREDLFLLALGSAGDEPQVRMKSISLHRASSSSVGSPGAPKERR